MALKPKLPVATAQIIDLAAARRARIARTLPARPYTDAQHAHAMRIGDQMADAINSGRVQLGRSPLLGTVGREEELVRRLEAAVEQLKRCAATGKI